MEKEKVGLEVHKPFQRRCGGIVRFHCSLNGIFTAAWLFVQVAMMNISFHCRGTVPLLAVLSRRHPKTE
jgi:hypothetical protein